MARSHWVAWGTERLEFSWALEDAIGQLTDKQREALALWLEGYNQTEIGERLGITQRAAAYRLELAIRNLQSALDHGQYTAGDAPQPGRQTF